MVSPHPDWDELDNGYRREATGIFVEPAVVRSGGGATMTSAGGIDSDDANAYSVDIRLGLETAWETWDTTTHFSDPRTAWELAHLLTHFFEASSAPEAAKSDLLHQDEVYGGEPKSLPTVVEDMDAEEAFRTLLYPSIMPEAMEELLDGDE